MKLLYCRRCFSVFSLGSETRSCPCGETKGRCITNLEAEYSGPGIPLEFAYDSFWLALRCQPENGAGEKFIAFVIPKECESFHKVK